MPLKSTVIEQQFQHKSVRQFTSEPITEAQLELIVAAAQRASTSSNLQVWSVVAITDRQRKERISEALGGRSYIVEAPVFLVWVADLARNEAIMRSAGVESETLTNLEVTLMAALDVGIASQNALLAAESLGLGGVFVGGIRNAPEAVIAELHLPAHVFPIVGMALGTPDPADTAGIRPRLPLAAVLHHETYDPTRWETAAASYETDYEAYFATQGAPGRSWARTVVSRLGKLTGLHGRHTIRASLKRQGFDSE